MGTFNPDGPPAYLFTYGFIRGMQAQTQFEGQCWNSVEVFLVSIESTKEEFTVAYLPQNWFNLLDRFRVNLVDWSIIQTDCQVYYLLGAVKTLLTLEGFSALIARAVPQSLFFSTIFQNIQTYYDEGNWVQLGVEVGGLTKIILGQSVN